MAQRALSRQMALRQADTNSTKKYVERGFVQAEPSYPLAAAGVGPGLILAVGILLAARQNRT